MLRPSRVQAHARTHCARRGVAAGAVAWTWSAAMSARSRHARESRRSAAGRSARKGSGTELRLGVDRQRLARCAAEVQRQRSTHCDTQFARAGIQLQAVSLPPQDVVTHAHAITVLNEAKSVYPGWSAQFRIVSVRRAARARRSANHHRTSCRGGAFRASPPLTRCSRRACAGVDAILTPTLAGRTAAGRAAPDRTARPQRTCRFGAGGGNLPCQHHGRAGLVHATAIGIGEPAIARAETPRRTSLRRRARIASGDPRRFAQPSVKF